MPKNGTKFPAEPISWRDVESSNVRKVGWDKYLDMYVMFHDGGTYVYVGVTRQRVIAAIRSKSVGQYINKHIKPHYNAVKIA
jgi:hypothetical protein